MKRICALLCVSIILFPLLNVQAADNPISVTGIDEGTVIQPGSALELGIGVAFEIPPANSLRLRVDLLKEGVVVEELTSGYLHIAQPLVQLPYALSVRLPSSLVSGLYVLRIAVEYSDGAELVTVERAILFSVSTSGADPPGPAQGGWRKLQGSWYYRTPEGKTLTGLHSISATDSAGKKVTAVYLLDKNGACLTGKQKVQESSLLDAGTYYFMLSESGGVPYCFRRSGFVTLNGRKYYFKPSGASRNDGRMLTGLHSIENQRYYFNAGGVMSQNRWESISGKRYFFSSPGYMHTGWLRYNNETYYLLHTGEMQTGWLNKDGQKFYFTDKGVMVTNWQKISGMWYLFFNKGVMLKGWQYDGSHWYYLKNGGDMQTGWLSDGGEKYFLNPGGDMAVGWKRIYGQWYYFNSSGAMQTGWQRINGQWYALDSSGAMATSWLLWKNTYYYLDSSGAMVTGWKFIEGKWYFFDASGAMHKGWILSSGKWYFLGSDGSMLTGGVTTGGKRYFLLGDGSMFTGWRQSGGNWHYYNPSSGEMAAFWQYIGGHWYYFFSDGRMARNIRIGGNRLGASGAMQ